MDVLGFLKDVVIFYKGVFFNMLPTVLFLLIAMVLYEYYLRRKDKKEENNYSDVNVITVHDYLKKVEGEKYKKYAEEKQSYVFLMAMLAATLTLPFCGFSVATLLGVVISALAVWVMLSCTFSAMDNRYAVKAIKTKDYTYSFKTCRKALKKDGMYLVETEDDNLYEVDSKVQEGDKLLVVKYKDVGEMIYSNGVADIKIVE